MIEFRAVTKNVGPFWLRQTILEKVSIRFERCVNYVVLGEPASGKTTLLGLMAGTLRPSIGEIHRQGLVSLPLGSAARVFPDKTGVELISVLSRLYRTKPAEVERFVGDTFNFERELLASPIRSLSQLDRLRLSYAIGYALPADFLLFDGSTSAGDQAFRDLCAQCLTERRGQVAMLLTTDNVRLAKEFGDVAAILHRGKLYPFPSVDEAIAAFREAGGGQDADGLQQARRLIATGQTAQAIGALQALIARDGNSVELVEALVEAQLREGKVHEAEKTALDAIADGLSSPKLLFILARIAESQGRFEDTIRFCEKGRADAGDSREFNLVLARAYEQTGAHGKAGEAYRAVARQEGNANVMRLAERNFAKAEMWPDLLEIATQAVAADPASAHYGTMRFQALCQLEIYDQAGEALKQLAVANIEAALGALVKQRRVLSVERFAALLGGLDAQTVRSHAGTRIHEMIVVSIRRDIAAERRAGHAAVVAYLSALLNQISGAHESALDVTPVEDR